jgi:hypothetical protein
MTTAVARFPFVSKADILRVYRPGAESSDRTFQTLRKHGFVSAGVSIHHRRQGRVLGQLRCYAALNLDAVVLARLVAPRRRPTWLARPAGSSPNGSPWSLSLRRISTLMI